MARKYLPSGLTVKERRNPALRRRLASCIRKVEKSACPKSVLKRKPISYRRCKVNPVATCRRSVSRRG